MKKPVPPGQNALLHGRNAPDSGDNTNGQIVSTYGSLVVLENSIVWANIAGQTQIVNTNYGSILARYCNIRGGYNGAGNINTNPMFEYNSFGRLSSYSKCIDQGSSNSLPGFRLVTRYDMDGEARLRKLANGMSEFDIGADEYVYRLAFPTVVDTNTGGIYSEVDEASGVSFLGTNFLGAPLIAVVDDEDRTNFHIYKLNSDADGILASYNILITNSSYSGDRSEVHDLEGITFDNTSNILYLITSQTKCNRYRDVDNHENDPVTDPPSNDYDRRRNMVIRINLDSTLTNVTSISHFDTENVLVPDSVGYDANNGLIAFVRQRLGTNEVLGEKRLTNKVLIAWNWTVKHSCRGVEIKRI